MNGRPYPSQVPPGALPAGARQHPRLPQAQPAATQPPLLPRHPDARLGAAIQAARQAGYDDGVRAAYPRGWRHGVGQALLGGILLGALAMHAAHRIAALLHALP